MPLTIVGVLLAGCGGGSPTGGVASLGSHPHGTSSTAVGSSGGEASSGSESSRSGESPNGGEASPGSKAIAFSACMRSQGVANFPNPKISTSAGGTSVKVAIHVGALQGNNPRFASAQQACRKLLPNGGVPTRSAPSPAEQTQYLKAAACIRSHGIPNFPDPTFSGGGVHIEHRAIDQSSPVFKAAVQACKSLIPGGLHGGG
jgi:hypothetical protein